MATSLTSSLLPETSTTTNLPPATSTTSNLSSATPLTSQLPPATSLTSKLPPATSLTSHLPPTTSSTSHLLPSISTARACNINEVDLFVVLVIGEENILIEAEIKELDDVTMIEDVEGNANLELVKINTPRPSLYLYNEIPEGMTCWEPNVDEPYLPLEGKRFETIEECVEFYSVYAEKGGSEFKKSAQKKTKSGLVKSKKKFVQNFTFQYLVENSELVAMFWADEVAKCNYKEFGDIISFDATFRTNKYDMVFVPFTRIDNHLKDLIPPALRRNTNRYGEKDEAIKKLTNEANFVVDECLFLLRKDKEQLKQFVENLENIKKEIQVKVPNPPSQKTCDVIEDIYAIKKPKQNLVNNLQKASNKGGRRGERIKSGRE
uniref:Zinc finger, SWIM-type n=1 Tax=Tanacetum cinerariifolium TaxID=118510 RepID=A0A6L2KL85_TANCI|nr:zinc finger, SWIM-type [Tanacetum cinerariifolium]